MAKASVRTPSATGKCARCCSPSAPDETFSAVRGRYRAVERSTAQLETETDVEISAPVLHSAVSTNPGQASDLHKRRTRRTRRCSTEQFNASQPSTAHYNTPCCSQPAPRHDVEFATKLTHTPANAHGRRAGKHAPLAHRPRSIRPRYATATTRATSVTGGVRSQRRQGQARGLLGGRRQGFRRLGGSRHP
jgi:hypothetical protein